MISTAKTQSRIGQTPPVPESKSARKGARSGILFFTHSGPSGAGIILVPILAVAITAGVRALLSDRLANLPFILFIAPVLLSGWYGGIRSGVIAITLSLFAGWYLFVPPFYTLAKGTPNDVVRLSLFFLIGLGICSLSDRVQRSRIAAQRSERLFQSTFENAAVGMAHVGLDGRWLRVNQRLSFILDYPEVELLSQTFADHAHPGDADIARVRMQAILAGDIESYSLEKRYHRRAKSTVWVNLTMSLQRDDNGSPEYFIFVVEDITQRKQDAEALEQIQQRLSLALAAGGLGVWDWDVRTDRLYWGEGVAAMNGRTEANAPRTFSEFLDNIHPDDRPGIEQAVKATLERHQTYNVEFRTIWPDGSIHWVVRKGMVMRDEEGRPVRMLGVGSDITERKHTEQEARRAKRQVEDILSSITERFIALDREWRFTYVNQRVVERTGKPREELIGKNIWKLYPDAANTLLWSEFHRVMEDRIPRRFETTSVIDNHNTIHEVHAYPTDEGICAYVLDITDRKRAEEALGERETFYRTVGDAVPDFIWVTDPNGKAVYVNHRWQEYTGKTLRDLNQLGWAWFNHPEDEGVLEEGWTLAMRERTKFEAEFRYRRHDGVYRWFMVRAVPMKDENGAIYQWVGTSTDIHGLKEAESKLRHYNEQLEQFAFASAHDLQEPLRNISIYSELLMRRLGDKLDPESQEYFGIVHGGARRMASLVKALLTYTRAVEGETRATLVDSSSAANQAIAGLASAIADANALVTLGELPHLYVFQPHLIQLFQNLIGNALKYRDSQRRPEIRVWAEQQGLQWIFTVQDNGIGIHADYHDRIFGVFKRLHGREVEGTGIGLAISKRIVEHYGGRIWVESTPGQGAAFRFTLPAHEEALNA